MSTDYKPLTAIPFDSLFDGRLAKYGICETIKPDTSESVRYLLGRDGILRVFSEENGRDSSFERPSFTPMPWSICDALTAEFETEFVSEHDHRYWGFDTAGEWDAYQNKIAADYENEFYADIIRFYRGKSHDLEPGTIGFAKATVARSLIDRDPSLMKPDKRDALLALIDEADEQKAVVVQLTPEELAMAELMMARTDDLPKA